MLHRESTLMMLVKKIFLKVCAPYTPLGVVASMFVGNAYSCVFSRTCWLGPICWN